MSAPVATRRQWLVGAGGLLGAAIGVPAAGMVEAAEALPETGAALILQARHFQLPEDVRARLGARGAQVLTLEDDPVRMWRGQWSPLLGRRDTRLLGVTRWPEFLLVQGLAAESRRHVRYQRFDHTTGALVWLIA